MPILEYLHSIIPRIVQHPYQRAVSDAILPSIILCIDKKLVPKTGESKLGGTPDFPPGQTWPTNSKDKPMSFLAQIRLEDVATHDLNGLLPPTGVLYFFFDWENGLGGTVQYCTGEQSLTPATPPEYLTRKRRTWWQKLFNLSGSNKMLTERSFVPKTDYQLPFYDSIWSKLMLLRSDTPLIQDIFIDEVKEDLGISDKDEEISDHHLLGHYHGIQHSFHELELIEGGDKAFADFTTADFQAASKWLLLFQIGSDEDLNFSIGDWGRAYFFIHTDDLKERRFDRVRVVEEYY